MPLRFKATNLAVVLVNGLDGANRFDVRCSTTARALVKRQFRGEHDHEHAGANHGEHGQSDGHKGMLWVAGYLAVRLC